ncbi:MAG: sulfatase [Candidatus Eisenbacteria bacterium]|nr:sulfatase [Candidatus Eisenbacteria bacterium]
MTRGLLLIAVLAAGCGRQSDPVFLDLAATFSDSLASGARAQPTTIRLGSGAHPAIVVPGDGGFRARMVVPPGARLRFAPMLPEGVAGGGDVRFSVAVRTRGRSPEMLWETRKTTRSRRLGEVTIDLARYAGASVELWFESLSPLADDVPGGWGVWVAPRVTSAVRPRGSSSLVLITVDALRADRLGCYGDSLGRTPVIDGLAARGALFSRAFTAFNVTNPSLATLFTGLYGREHRVYNLNTPLEQRFTTMAEMLKGYGYRTAAVVSARHIAPDLSGLAQGFDSFQAPAEGEWRADEVTARASDWLGGQGIHPFFLWVHYFDPHMLYTPPDSFARLFAPEGPVRPGARSLADSLSTRSDLTHHGPVGAQWLAGMSNPAYPEAMYRGEVAFVDQQIGRLLATLRGRLLESKTLIVLTADHGESMGEHDIYFDHIGLYRPQVHIPLIFYAPGLVPQGVRRDDVISTVDFLPTISDLLSIAPSPEVGGFSFGRTILEGAPGERDLVIVQHADHRAATMRTPFWSLQRAWLPYSVVQVDTMFFDLMADPEELNNRSGADPRTHRMLTELQDWMDRARVGKAPAVSMDEATRRHLVTLGYLHEGPA